MRRGDIWTVSGGPNDAGKPRPAVLIQDERFDRTASLTLCGLTTSDVESPLFRLLIEPTPENGLREPSWIMVDKITTVAKTKIGTRLGRIADDDLTRLNRAILVFLGLAG